MRKFAIIVIILVACAVESYGQTKAYINTQTKLFDLTANIREDHRFFGYAAADTASQKLILFSIFTNDVEGNPHRLPLGAYYETSGLKEGDYIQYVSTTGKFVKLNYVSAVNKITTFYVHREFVAFEEE